MGADILADEERRPEDNPDADDKDSFSKFIDENLDLNGMPDAPSNAKTAKDDENINPPTNPFTSRFNRPPSGLSRFGLSKSDDDTDDDDEDPFTGSTGFLGKNPPFTGDRPLSGGRFGGNSDGSHRFGGEDSGNRFVGRGGFGSSGDSNPSGSRFGGNKTPPPPPSPFSPLGRLSSNRQPSSMPFGRTLPKTPTQKRAEALLKINQVIKELLPSLIFLLILIYFITLFNKYQPDALKNEIQQLQQTITQQEAQIRQLQAQIEAMSRER
ncbi:MAG: hypothetical protein CUN52_04830 [Phototrophicales bacterium]|nr:MAG: hypothetical protein CUN52_04830 [Phototrophicales bacterium]